MLDRSQTRLELALLGPPILSWDGGVLPIARRQARAMFYRLAVDLAPIPRSQLAFLFWPDVADSQARRNLTHLLTLLRQALPQPALLVTDTTTVALNPELAWSDTASFLRRTRTSAAADRPAALAAALDLHRGPLLDGFALTGCPEFEAWLDTERQVWERRIDDTLAALIESHTVARNYAAAIALARRALARDPLAEELHRRLITLYAATGDRTAALRQFEQCVVVLERELGVAPLPETRTVYAAVRDGESPLPLATAPRAAAPPPTPPALRAATSLPVAPTALIGRAAVLAELQALLLRADVRLLTLAGPGGVGKTRLALALAHTLASRFADGATFVPLAPLRDAALVPQAIAEALGLGEHDNRSSLLRLKDLLRERRLLLVLDNCEHVLAAAAEIAELLAAAPGLKVLSTSRALLQITGEQTYVVPALVVPDPAQLPAMAELAQIGAVALFLARAGERVPSFALTSTNAEVIAAICARLDGLPLAIELAAARAALLAPHMLLARLDRRLSLLTDGPRDLPERQRTLRATIDWSYALLDVSEQLLFGRLAVFAGGWTLDAAEQVAAAVGPLAVSVLDGLSALLNKSLIQRTMASDSELRFSMLETIREYALERLTERGEAELTQAAHAAYFVSLAELAEPKLHGPDQIAWFDRLDQEHPNLRIALAWLLDVGDSAGALRLGGAIHWFWYVRGYFSEGYTWLRRALSAAAEVGTARTSADALVVARARRAYAHITLMRGDQLTAYDQLVALLTDLRTVAGISDSAREVQKLIGRTIIVLTQAQVMAGKPRDMLLTDELIALAHALDDPSLTAFHAMSSGRGLLYGVGRPDLARPFILQAAILFRQLGDVYSLALLNIDLGMLALLAGDLTIARGHFSEARVSAMGLRDRLLEADATHNLGEIARLQGDDMTAATSYITSLRLYQNLGTLVKALRVLHDLGYLSLHQDDVVQARTRFAESLLGVRERHYARGQGEAIAGLACIAAAAGSVEYAQRAARLWGAADAIHRANHTTPWPSDRAERARYEPLARTQLGNAAYEAAYTAGAALSLDEAVAEALRV